MDCSAAICNDALPRDQRNQQQQSISAASTARAQRTTRDYSDVVPEQSVAICRHRDHLSDLLACQKRLRSCRPTKPPTVVQARPPPRSLLKASASISSGHSDIHPSRPNHCAPRGLPTSRRNSRSHDTLRDPGRSEDRGPQRYCRIFSSIERAS